MKNKATTIILVCLSLTVGSVSSVMAKSDVSQGKYLGKKEASDIENETPVFPKVNLLEDDLIKKNPQFSNKDFWSEEDSSRVMKTEISSKDLSDTIFDMIHVASNKPMGMEEMPSAKGLDESNGDLLSGNRAYKEKSFKPPKTALIGRDHHHHYATIEEGYSGGYDPYKFKGVNSNKDIVYTIKGERWVLDNKGKPLLLSQVNLPTELDVSYVESINDIIADMANYFFESISPILLNNLNIKEENKDREELESSELKFVLRDVCVSSLTTRENMLVRFKVHTVDYSIESLDIFYGMKCED
jgi:hypothetical protein